MEACAGSVAGGKMVCACQVCAPRRARALMFGASACRRASGRRPSIEMMTIPRLCSGLVFEGRGVADGLRIEAGVWVIDGRGVKAGVRVGDGSRVETGPCPST